MEPATVAVRELIHLPERYDDPAYRRWIAELWLKEQEAASTAFLDNNATGPCYGSASCSNGWRVD